MKKAVVVVLTVMLALAMCATSLAEVTTPFDDESLNVNVAVKMDDGDISSVFIGSSSTSASMDDILNFGDLFEGVLYMNSSSVGNAWLGFVSDKLEAPKANAEGYGCYLQNNTGSTLTFSILLLTDPEGNLNNGAYTTGSNSEYALVDMAGNKTVMTTPEQVHPYDGYVTHSNIEIPADFEGYLFVPFTSLWKIWGTETDVFTTDIAVTGSGWLNATGDYSTGDLGIDNLFFYGANVESVDADLIAINENGNDATPTSDNEAEATQPADDSTQPAQDATPSASDNNASDNEGSFPWVVIVIVAVVVIAIIIIAVAASKKKKNSDN